MNLKYTTFSFDNTALSGYCG